MMISFESIEAKWFFAVGRLFYQTRCGPDQGQNYTRKNRGYCLRTGDCLQTAGPRRKAGTQPALLTA